ncbi:MAG: 50S ribosomal protein L18Ae [archaeon GB-1867-097]|nr:50S ribosomal protein L18a [Candidatus Verstraetearchaeota archaeon]MCS7373750.1 50S ribosomal protein L18Ae [Candidatus Culexmicrobium thermophilum]MCS7384949.1 50S ribosomal protein L18Ae [Candidatus Culexmicrobium thermophilum]HDO20679.1 50S ribosomal protein L18a [Candidatus Bathyarchaeota archaeon]
MEVKVYRIEGFMRLRTGNWAKFSMDIPALKPEDAIERAFSNISGLHKIKRSHIRVKSITVINPHRSKNPLIKSLLELKTVE